VGIEATPLILGVDTIRDFEARYGNGNPIPRGVYDDPNQIALRSLDELGNRKLYVVGTSADEAAVHKEIYDRREDGGESLNQEAWDRLFESGSSSGGRAKTISLKDELGK
jgi:hypothetical protein